MNKNKILSLVVSVFFLTGCSLVSSTTDGGVFRSDDGGKSFTQKVTIDEKTKISSVDVLSLAVNPQNGNEVYIGTKASGVFKTTDAGEKWQVVKVAPSTPSKVYSLAIDSKDPAIVYAAAIVAGRGKILKSTDAGANWKEIYTEPASGPFVLSLALDPLDSQKIYAGTTKKQIISSDNGGDTWKSLYAAQAEVTKIAVDNFNPDLIYFAINNSGLVRTKDGGKSFENLTEHKTFADKAIPRNVTAIAADPNKASWIYVGTDAGLLRSKDGGDNWEIVRVLNSPKENIIRGIAINPQNSDEIIYGAALAIYKSVDGGQSWATTQFNGSRTFEAIAYNRQNPGVIYVGMNKR